MQHQRERQSGGFVAPQVEDAGLFKGNLVSVNVTLSPQVHLSVRHDLVVTAVTANGLTFEVLFAGRRKAAAAWLLGHLAHLRGQGKASEGVTVPVLIQGAWRTTFAPDPSGWDARRRQLVAAIWTVKAQGQTQTFGEPPMR